MPSFRQIMRRVFDSDRNNLKISQDITGIGDGEKDTVSAGTRVALAASTACKMVDVQAKEGNTGVVVVGGATVVAALATRRGAALTPLSSVRIYCDNLADIYLDSMVDAEGVTFVYYT